MKEKPQRMLLDISWEALLRLLAFGVGIWIIITLKEILILLFGVFILVAAVNPTISRWEKHMSRVLAVSLFYVLMIGVLALVSSLLFPRLIHQLNELNQVIPSITEKAKLYLNSSQSGATSVVDQITQGIHADVNNISHDLLQSIVSFFGGVAALLTGLVISFYLLLEENNAREFFHQVLPHHRYEVVYRTVSKISERMGSWVRGQILLIVIIGLSDLVGYTIVGLAGPHPLAGTIPLAIWAGLCELIPFIGPFLGLLPAFIVALTTGTVLQAILVLIIGGVVIQQLEAHIVVPKIMSRAVGLSPVLVILSLLIGDKILGIVGAFIAIPVAAVISVVVGEWPQLRHIWESSES